MASEAEIEAALAVICAGPRSKKLWRKSVCAALEAAERVRAAEPCGLVEDLYQAERALIANSNARTAP